MNRLICLWILIIPKYYQINNIHLEIKNNRKNRSRKIKPFKETNRKE